MIVNCNRLKELDAIRGLAAIFVLLYHYTDRYYQIYHAENKLPFSVEFSHYGVQAFFIVSSFVIFITFIIVSIFSLPGRETTIFEFIVNLSMIHTQFAINSVDGVYWTLLYELKFYFLMLMLFTLKGLNRIEFIALILMISTLLIHFFVLSGNLLYKILRELFILDYISFLLVELCFIKFIQEVNL